MSRQRMIPTLVALLTLGVFAQTVNFEFVNIDDFTNIVRNPLFNPFNFEHLHWIWTRSYDAMYIPVTYTLWGFLSLARDDNGQMQPGVFHAANVVVHVVNVLLAYAILNQLARVPFAAASQPRQGNWRIYLAALVFAIHPIQVESVAWVSSFRDLLAGLFVLLSIWEFLKIEKSHHGRHVVLTLVFLTFGLLSKPSAVVMPLMVLAIVLYRGTRISRGEFWTVFASFLLVIPCLLWTKALQPGGPQFGHPPPLAQRPVVALDAIGFYLSKIIWPVHLGVEYARPPQFALNSRSIFWAAGALAIVLALLSRRRKLMAIVALFVAAILPVLGLVPFNYQFFSTVADHYVYLAMLAVMIGVYCLIENISQSFYRWGWPLLAAIVFGLGLMAIRQVRTWENSLTLFAHNVEVNPRSYISHFHLAEYDEQQRDLRSAENELRAALQISPHYSVARTELGMVLMQEGKIDAGLDELLASLKDAKLEDPNADLSAAYQRIGEMFQKRGRTKEAEECFREVREGR